MRFSLLTSLVPALAAATAAAAPVLEPRASNPVTLTAVRSGSPLQYQSIQASGSRFWIGKGPTTFCQPEAVDCTKYTNSTTIVETGAANVATTATFDVVVPGGQFLYVSPYGELAFVQGGPEQGTPQGSFLSGFVYTPPAQGQAYGDLTFTAGGATGFVACPTNGGFPYEIFANVAGANVAACTGFDMIATPWTGAPAYEYT